MTVKFSTFILNWTRGRQLCGALFLVSVFLTVALFSHSFGASYTNYIVYADQLNQQPWVRTTANVTVNAADSPDGGHTAEKISSAGADGYLSQVVPSLRAGIYDYTVYLRSDKSTELSIYIVTGSEGKFTLAQTDVSVSPEWRRFNLRTDVFSHEYFAIQIGGGSSFEKGESVFAWGAQLTRLASASDPSPPLLLSGGSIVRGSSASPLDINKNQTAFLFSAPFAVMAGFAAYLIIANTHRRKFGQLLARKFPQMNADIFAYPASAKANLSVPMFSAAVFVAWSLTVQLAVSTPLSVFVSQPDAYAISLVRIIASGIGVATVLALGLATALLIFPHAVFKNAIKLLLIISLLAAVEQLLIADIRPFGELTGQPVQWDEYVGIAKIDFIALFLLFAAGLYFFRKASLKSVINISAVILFFSVAPVVVFAISNAREVGDHQRGIYAPKNYTPFFEFSNEKNIFFYQPDSVSSDVVMKIFNEHPEIAKAFDGFTFFSDNTGAYNGTLLSTYSVFTGRNANIRDNGYSEVEFAEAAQQFGFPLVLEKNGFRVDYVPVYSVHCVSESGICLELHLRDLTPKSLGQLGAQRAREDWLLLLDVSLFRHAPHIAKKNVYNNGDWILRDHLRSWYSKTRVGLGPVLKEVTDNLKVTSGAPRFKWYAGLGAHQPETYDENCKPLPKRIYSVEAGLNQTLCVLREYVDFLEELKKAGVYDETALVLNADTGSGNVAYDLTYPENAAQISNRDGLEPSLNHISMARPALLVKPLNGRGELKISQAQTHQINLPATVLDLADIPSDYDAPSVFDIGENDVVNRKFYRIHFPIRYANTMMDFDEYDIIGPANHWTSYKLTGWFRRDGSSNPEPPDDMIQSEIE